MIITRKRTFKILSMALAFLLCLSLFSPIASAEGSLYISSYTVSMTAGSNGNVTAWFQITGTSAMDQIGAVEVALFENGTIVKTFYYTSTPGMMTSNKNFYGSSVTYSGIVGRTYSAYVTFQAGKNGDWDNRGMDTTTVTAKN